MSDTNSGLSRRTLAKGAAWAVPAVAVAAAAPAHAASKLPPPPPPEFNWSSGCATVGNGAGGCNGSQKTPQVPFYASNPTTQTLQFQILGAKFWTDNDNEPVAFSTPQLWTNNGSETSCGPQVKSTGCGGYLTVTLSPGDCVDLWLVSSLPLGNSSAFWAKFQYRWVTPCVTGPPATGGEVVGDAWYTATPAVIIPDNNCDGSTVDTSCSSTNRLQAPAQRQAVQETTSTTTTTAPEVTTTTTTKKKDATTTTTTSTTEAPVETATTTEAPVETSTTTAVES